MHSSILAQPLGKSSAAQGGRLLYQQSYCCGAHSSDKKSDRAAWVKQFCPEVAVDDDVPPAAGAHELHGIRTAAARVQDRKEATGLGHNGSRPLTKFCSCSAFVATLAGRMVGPGLWTLRLMPPAHTHPGSPLYASTVKKSWLMKLVAWARLVVTGKDIVRTS